MKPDRFRVFTKRGAAVGLLAVVGAAVLLLVASALIASLLLLVF